MRADEAHSRFDRLHVLFAHYLWYILAKVPRVFQNDGDGRNESKRPKGSIYAFLIIVFSGASDERTPRRWSRSRPCSPEI